MVPYGNGIEILSPRAGFLVGRGANYTSQFGEDGLIEACLENFGSVNRWCFEVGAADGTFFSNTARLREQGWKTVLIEGDAEQYDRLQKIRSETIWTIPKHITPRSLDLILAECGVPADIDFGVIDIDGQDYWIWDGLENFRPRLLLVEFDYGSENKPDWTPEPDGQGQATFKAIERLGREKGYEPLAKTICNLLFAATEIL